MNLFVRLQAKSLPLLAAVAILLSTSSIITSCSRGDNQAAPAPSAQPTVAPISAQPAPAPAPAAAAAMQPGPPPGAATPDQLQELVSPIALYPDLLLAQILAASSYPDQIVIATQWLKQNPGLTGDALATQVNAQPWDPSIKSLTQFPSVLQTMSDNLAWTSALGEANYNQPGDVMNAIQVMRNRAVSAGTLKTTPQQKVEMQPAPPPAPVEGGGQPQPAVQQTVIIQPAQPNTVYVPQYNPTTSYGAPVAAPPGYSGTDLLLTGIVSFGAGMLVGSLINNGHNDWGCNWYGGGGGNVKYNKNVYVNNNNIYAGGRPGGYPRPGYPGGTYPRPGYGARPVPYPATRPAYNGGGYNGGAYNRPNGGIPATRPYNPNTAIPYAGNKGNPTKPNFPGASTLPANAGGSNLNGNNIGKNGNGKNRPNQPGGNPVASTRPAAAKPANRASDPARGFASSGQKPKDRSTTGGRSGALGGYEAGGAAKAASGRGQSSLKGNQFASGGGGGGGGKRGGGGGGNRGGGGGGGGGGRRKK